MRRGERKKRGTDKERESSPGERKRSRVRPIAVSRGSVVDETVVARRNLSLLAYVETRLLGDTSKIELTTISRQYCRISLADLFVGTCVRTCRVCVRAPCEVAASTRNHVRPPRTSAERTDRCTYVRYAREERYQRYRSCRIDTAYC